jgi:ABC-2 type transport system permease protein
MTAVYVLWLRELRRYTRSRVQIAASLGQPMLYLLALGFGLGPTFQKAGNGSYMQFVAPGVIGMTILFSAVFSGIGLLWDRQFGFLKETLVAPVPRLHIMLGKTLGGANVALLQGLLMFAISLLVGFRPASLMSIPLGLGFMVLIAIVFAALGTAIGSVLQDMQGFQLTMNFLVMPIFFLSGALYPLGGLPKAMAVITWLDPLAYGVDGLRSALIASSHFGMAIDVAALALFGTALLAVGSHLFSRIEI